VDAGERHPANLATTVISASIDERATSQNAPGTTIIGWCRLESIPPVTPSWTRVADFRCAAAIAQNDDDFVLGGVRLQLVAPEARQIQRVI
jgi:hypothetical protein